MYYTNDGIKLYVGDMQPGDRVATAQEITAFNNLPATVSLNKWAQVDAYELALTVTLTNGHKYACNKNARLNIIQERDSLLGLGANTTEPWIEDWGTFPTSAIELQEVLDTAINLIRTYRNSVFGV